MEHPWLVPLKCNRRRRRRFLPGGPFSSQERSDVLPVAHPQPRRRRQWLRSKRNGFPDRQRQGRGHCGLRRRRYQDRINRARDDRQEERQGFLCSAELRRLSRHRRRSLSSAMAILENTTPVSAATAPALPRPNSRAHRNTATTTPGTGTTRRAPAPSMIITASPCRDSPIARSRTAIKSPPNGRAFFMAGASAAPLRPARRGTGRRRILARFPTCRKVWAGMRPAAGETLEAF